MNYEVTIVMHPSGVVVQQIAQSRNEAARIVLETLGRGRGSDTYFDIAISVLADVIESTVA